MQNWIIYESKKIVYKVGVFFVQITTVENVLEQIYSEYAIDEKDKENFSESTFGKKNHKLSRKVKIGIGLQNRLLELGQFRNKIAHNVLEYNPNDKKVYVKNDLLDEELDRQISNASELLTDIYITLDTARNSEGYKKSIDKNSY